MGGLRTTRGVVGIKLETTAYQFLEPLQADTWNAFDVSYDATAESYQRKELNVHFGKKTELPGTAMAELSFSLLFMGAAGAANVPSYLDVFLLACGFQKGVYTASPKVEYKPWSVFDGAGSGTDPVLTNPGKSYSLAFWQDGVRYALKGAQGNCVISGKIAGPVEFKFTFKGAYEAFVTDSENSVSTSAPTATPPTNLSALLAVHAFSAICTEWSVDLGNVLSPVQDMNTAAGLKGYMITDRRPVAKFNPEVELVAGHDFYARWRAATLGSFSVGALGTATGNKIAILGPNCQYRAPKLGERESIRTFDIEAPLLNNTSTDGGDLTITTS